MDFALVDIPGLGKLPQYFNSSYSSVDMDDGKEANHHHEGRVGLTCGEEPWGFNDHFNVSGWKTKDGYQLNIVLASESGVGLYRSGRVVLDYKLTQGYDLPPGRWAIKGYVPGREARREWLFCNPQGVVDLVIAGLDCFKAGQGDSEFQAVLKPILDNLRNNQGMIVAGAARYAEREDCTASPPTSSDPYACANAMLCPGPDGL